MIAAKRLLLVVASTCTIGATQSVIQQVAGVGPYANTALLGDVDGDGRNDFAIADWFANAGRGSVTVFSGASGQSLWSTDGATLSTTRYGEAIEGIEDLDGDGRDDVIVHANGFNPSTLVHSGADGSVLFRFNQPPSTDGSDAANAGDINGDGFEDIIVGRNQIGSTRFAYAVVYSGRNGGQLTLVTDTTFYFGREVAGVGDVNGDGLADFAVSAPGLDVVPAEITVFSGADSGVLYRITGPSSGFREIDTAGDVDLDGVPDIVAVNSVFDVRVYSGANGSLLTTLASPNRSSGRARAAGDVNGDGFGDLIIGWTGVTSSIIGAGVARVVSGRDWGVLFEFQGATRHVGMGLAVDGGRDIDGDGFDDIVAVDELALRVFSLGSAGTPGREFVDGVSCTGVAGRRARIDYDGSADLGSTIGVRIRGAQPNRAAVLLVGDPVDLALDPFGLVRCGLYAAPWTSSSITATSRGVGRVDLALPVGVAPVGYGLGLQWAVLDPVSTALGVRLSNALELTIGTRTP